MILVQILIGLAGLGLMVFIHELGHFIAARAVGIEVEAFALGWGPTLWRRKGKVTEYRLAAFPIGGYCKMKGEQDMNDALQNRTGHMQPSPGSFFAARPWQRMIVSFAGPFVNLAFAVLVMGLIWWVGYSYESTDNRIALVADFPALYATPAGSAPGLDALNTVSSPASRAGLRTGDRIVAIDGQAMRSFRDIQMSIAQAARQELDITVDRGGQTLTVRLVPLLDTNTGGGRIGISQWIDPVVDRYLFAAIPGQLESGDRILAIDGQPIHHTLELESWYRSLPPLPRSTVHNPVARLASLATRCLQPCPVLQIARAGQTIELPAKLAWTSEGQAYLPFVPKGITFHTPDLNPVQALARGTTEAFDTIRLTVRSLGLLFQGLNPTKAVSGPIRITYYVGEVATQGFSIGFSEGLRSFFHFLAFISIALFFGNLLPIPALDGGQILLFIGEAVSRRPLKPDFVQKYQIIGAVLVFGLLILALSGDVLFLFGL